MNHTSPMRATIFVTALIFFPVLVRAQGTLADYERAQSLRKLYEGAALNLPGRINWIESTNHFWYSKSVNGGNAFVLVDAETLVKNPAFDHEKLAASLSASSGEKYKALELPFLSLAGRPCSADSTTPCTLTFVDNEHAIQFTAGENNWKCDLSNYNCTKLGPADRRGPNVLPQLLGPSNRPPDRPRPSPDGAWEALIKNYNALFSNPYQLTNLAWRKDSRTLTFEYNQRGHQVYRVIEVDGMTGNARSVVNEESKTFFCYSGKKYRYDVKDGKELVWMSERDGWNHLYLFDGETGKVKNQITRGEWVVRGVEKVDEDKRQIWFRASGMYPGQDPYFNYYYRINFDGSGLERLTDAEANHTVSFSPDMRFFVDTWSRVDLPTASQLRRTADGKVLTELERVDIQELAKAGWKEPEVFKSDRPRR
jgi:hypothetical protein